MNALVAANYAPEGLMQRIGPLVELVAGGGARPTPEQLAPLDQFHTGGLPATARLAELLEIPPGSVILDAGAGLGGPARYLANVLDIYARGVDLSPAFVEAAQYLTQLTGLHERVSFAVGDVLAVEVVAETFDAAIMQHVAMNISDRHSLYREMHRVLKPGAPFIAYDVVSLGPDPVYPLPWAPDTQTSFLLTADQTVSALSEAGFTVTFMDLAGEAAALSFPPSPSSGPPPFAVLLGTTDMPRRIANLRDGLMQGSLGILTVRAIRE